MTVDDIEMLLEENKKSEALRKSHESEVAIPNKNNKRRSEQSIKSQTYNKSLNTNSRLHT